MKERLEQLDGNKADGWMNAPEVVDLPLSQIHRCPTQPRFFFDEEALEELAASIRDKGVLQPILVRVDPKLSSPEALSYEIISGERRWRAAELAGLVCIPSIIRDVDDEEMFVMSVLENIQRSNLNVIEEAMSFAKLMNQRNCGQEELGRIVNKSRSYVANTMRMLKLPEEVQSMVVSNRLTASHAKLLIGQPDALSLARRILRDQLTVRQTEDLIEEMGQRKKGNQLVRSETRGQLSPNSEEHETALAELKFCLEGIMSMKVNIFCSEKTGEGKMVILFKDRNQLDSLCQRLAAFAEEKPYRQ